MQEEVVFGNVIPDPLLPRIVHPCIVVDTGAELSRQGVSIDGQAIMTFIGAYCISSLVTLFFTLNLYLRQFPFLANTIMTITLVACLTYFAMPILSRLLRRWLYSSFEHLQE
ncbi:MAG: hypothetical protein WCC17_01905 [Candidatus Nitrosopolaris sp.]